MKIKRITVPTDLSGASLPAVHLAADLARKFAAEIVLVHAIEPYLGATGDPFGASALVAVLEAHERSAKSRLAKHAEALKRRGLRTRSLVTHGSASSVMSTRRAGCVAT